MPNNERVELNVPDSSAEKQSCGIFHPNTREGERERKAERQRKIERKESGEEGGEKERKKRKWLP